MCRPQSRAGKSVRVTVSETVRETVSGSQSERQSERQSEQTHLVVAVMNNKKYKMLETDGEVSV